MIQIKPSALIKSWPLGQDVQVLRHPQVCAKLQISSSKLFDLIAKGQFPKPFTIISGGRAVGWLEQEVDQWILDRIETCRLESI
jgi:prophage regulatory protein